MEGKYDEDKLGFDEEHRWWPARNYGCSFCKREFKSAQALGGHMNVHRRDRARLRSSLWLPPDPESHHNHNHNQYYCPKPNNPTTTSTTLLSPSPLSYDQLLMNCTSCSPNCLTSSTSSCLLPFLSPSTSEDKKPRLSSIPSPSDQDPFLSKSTRNNGFGVVEKEIMKGSYEEEEQNGYKNNEQKITLELGIGLLKHQEETTLDLELRL